MAVSKQASKHAYTRMCAMQSRWCRALAQARPNNQSSTPFLAQRCQPQYWDFRVYLRSQVCIRYLPTEVKIRFIECLVTCPSTFDVEWSFLQSVWTCLSQSSNIISAFTCIFTYTITTVYITFSNPMRMRRNQPRGYINF